MDMSTKILIGVFVVLWLIFIIGSIYSYYCDKKRYNSGICPFCGKRLNQFDVDSQGNRGYTCDDEHCYYTVWIGFKSVDKNHHKLLKTEV